MIDIGALTQDAGVPLYMTYEAPPVDREEVLRYAGIPAGVIRNGNEQIPSDVLSIMQKAVGVSEGCLTFNVGYLSGRLEADKDGMPILPFCHTSKDLKRNLDGCSAFVMFAATVGAGMDRLIKRYELADPALGAMLHALGAERVESLCNAFNADVKETALSLGYKCHPRYSPGYGDLDIKVQKEFLNALDASRRLGITLSETYLCSPSKTVTAVIGLEKIS